MCARYTLRSGVQVIRDLFNLDAVEEMPARYNVAPTQDIPAITQSREGERKLRMLRWGLVPHWAKGLAIGVQMINARADTLEEKPAFRTAFDRRRCLIPADGFFEWTDVIDEPQGNLFDMPASNTKKRKQPYYITMKDSGIFAFAGLWERWSDENGNLVDSCTIITTEPNSLVAPLHDRMPAIIRPEDYGLWLDRHQRANSHLQALLAPYPAGEMKTIPVNPIVGNSRIDTPQCIEPFAA